MINKIRPEYRIISAPALQEHFRNCNNLIEKVKLWKDGLYADSIGQKVPCDFRDTFSNFFQATCKVYKKI